MLVYQADPQTLEYIGTENADPDPMTPGQYLMPAGCYTDAPGEFKQGYTQIRKGNTWEYVVDLRGTTVYSTKDKTQYKIVAFMENIPSGYTDQVPTEFQDYCTWNGSDWYIDEVKKTAYENNIADNTTKAEMSSYDSQIIRSMRSLINQIVTDGKIDTTSNDYKKFKIIDDIITQKRSELNVKG